MLIEKTVNQSFEIVAANVRAFFKQHDLTVFLDLDQKMVANNVGLDLAETRVFLFGNPSVGTYLMQEAPHLSVYLPLRLILVASGDTTTIYYESPTAWLAENLSEKSRTIIQNMDKLYDNLVNSLVK